MPTASQRSHNLKEERDRWQVPLLAPEQKAFFSFYPFPPTRHPRLISRFWETEETEEVMISPFEPISHPATFEMLLGASTLDYVAHPFPQPEVTTKERSHLVIVGIIPVMERSEFCCLCVTQLSSSTPKALFFPFILHRTRQEWFILNLWQLSLAVNAVGVWHLPFHFLWHCSPWPTK